MFHLLTSAPKEPAVSTAEEQILPELYEEARKRETALSFALLQKRRRQERDEQRLKDVMDLWPIGIGIVLAVFSPVMLITAQSLSPWIVTVIFPFVVLANRPELHVGPITHTLPDMMLYAQFPIEGILARIIIRRPLLPISVTLQVILFHFLGIVEVWLLNAVSQPILTR